MQWRFRFFIAIVWAEMIASIVFDIGDIIDLYLGLETNFAYLNLLFYFLLIAILYSITKRKELLYYTGVDILNSCIFIGGTTIAGVYIGLLQDNYIYALYGIGVLSLLLTLWVGYKMFLLFYQLSGQKFFVYALPFYAVGTLLFIAGEIMDLVDVFQGGSGNKQYWTIPFMILDIIEVLLCGIAFLRTKLETLQKNS